MDEFRIDDHKLIYHPRRVADWLEGKNIAPIYMELSPIGNCNHRCTFCGLDFMGYKSKKLKTSLLLTRMAELAEMGLKSVMFAGEGEPLLHKDFVNIASGTSDLGIDTSLTTNGVFFTKNTAAALLSFMSWIKVSFNAGTSETYAKLHGTKPNDFDVTISNICNAANLKRKYRLPCTLGIQSLLLPENENEMISLARIARETGVDYLVIKPYSHHPKSCTKTYVNLNYSHIEAFYKEIEAFSTKTFRVIVRRNAIHRWDQADKGYERCLGLPFWSYIDSEGNVWGCSIHMTDHRFCYGNISDNSFNSIWTSKARQENMNFVKNEMDASGCRINCRLEQLNRYLWRLKHPLHHDNFI